MRAIQLSMAIMYLHFLRFISVPIECVCDYFITHCSSWLHIVYLLDQSGHINCQNCGRRILSNQIYYETGQNEYVAI